MRHSTTYHFWIPKPTCPWGCSVKGLQTCAYIFHRGWWWGFNETESMTCWLEDQADRNSIVALELALETVTWLCACLSYSESNQCIQLCLHLCDGGEVRWAAVTRKLSGWALSFTLQESNPSVLLHGVTLFQEELSLTSGRWWRNPLLSTTHLPVVFPKLWVSINYYRDQSTPTPHITQIH